ncbi:TIR domain-containing protein [Erythrobacter sp. Alg231-14]|uniref:TIR domain-containing protein n=1 Tax=Erythrobacter sp. Alg231-14 TaxID=1922225 RepID=UPI00307B2C10
MAVVDVFISYSRDDAEKVGLLARKIASEGYEVWWDADLPPHMSYGDVITAKIGAAKAAVVVWSDTAAKSEWVRAEADVARNQKKLIQTSIDDVMPPLPFNQIQYAGIGDWNGEADHRGWSKVKQSLVALCGPRDAAATGDVRTPDADEIAATAPTKATSTPAPPPQNETPNVRNEPASLQSTTAPSTATSSAAKSGMSTPLIVGLGCGGVAVLGIIMLIALAVIGMAIEEDVTPMDGDLETVQPAMQPPLDDSSGPDVVTDGDYIPQLEAAPDGGYDTGAIPPPDMAAQPSGPIATGFVIATIQDPDGYTNVRSGPSTGSSIIARVEEGDIFTTYQQSESWWIVQLEDGTEGYIFADRIYVIGPQ